VRFWGCVPERVRRLVVAQTTQVSHATTCITRWPTSTGPGDASDHHQCPPTEEKASGSDSRGRNYEIGTPVIGRVPRIGNRASIALRRSSGSVVDVIFSGMPIASAAGAVGASVASMDSVRASMVTNA